MFLIRLALLHVVVIGIIGGGYWSVSHDVDQSLHDMWGYCVVFVEHFDRGVFYQSAVVWVGAVGRKFFLIEVPKRLLLYFLVPYIVIWLLPKRVHKWFRVKMRSTKASLLQAKTGFMHWLEVRMFGPYAGYALGLMVAALFFVVFYSLFWTYLALWLGFVKIPSFIAGFFTFLWRRVLFAIEKVPFATVVFKWGARASEWVDDQIPQVRWTPTPESKRNRARKLARKAIKLRRLKRKLLILSRFKKPAPIVKEAVPDEAVENKAR